MRAATISTDRNWPPSATSKRRRSHPYSKDQLEHQQVRKATAMLIPTGEFVQNIWQDIRHAIRTLGKSPGMSAISIVTLAIGIAVVSTVFSFVNSVFYRPLPYPDADRIVALTP